MVERWERRVDRALQSLRSEERRKSRDQKTMSEVFDEPTLRGLSRLISHGHIDTLDHCISTGKEANVFRATTPEGLHVAVKVYRVTTSTFRSHADYIWGDPRFTSAKPGKREMVETWASKEFKNLRRLVDAGCAVPTPLEVHKNLLVMEFIGEQGTAARAIKDVVLSEPSAVRDQLVDFVRRAWSSASLVHGDLSEFNVLWHDEAPVVIDTAQGVLRAHPRARELLERDLKNVVRYFDRLGAVSGPDAVGTITEELLGARGEA